MSAAQIEIQLIAAVVAAACAVPGVFLVLRRMALMSDAISHAILLGIVLAFFVVQDLASPFLVASAAATGVLTVALVELLHRTRLVREDAAIGLVFPALFSIGVILISRYAGNVHLDTDAVLLGELAFAPFNRFELNGIDLGPQALWLMGGILLANVLFVTIFFKELKLTTFDNDLAAALGFSPVLMHYLLMTDVSITAVGAFDAVGSILVVALMIAPPCAAYLITDDLRKMLFLSVGFGVAGAIGGYWLAHAFDVSIAGSIATVAGLVFLIVFLAAPRRGIVAMMLLRKRQRREFAVAMLLIHLYTHEDLPEAATECRIDHLTDHLSWSEEHAQHVVRIAVKNNHAVRDGSFLRLTDRGRQTARHAIVNFSPSASS